MSGKLQKISSPVRSLSEMTSTVITTIMPTATPAANIPAAVIPAADTKPDGRMYPDGY